MEKDNGVSYSENVIAAFRYAEAWSKEHNLGYVGTEHLIYGILCTKSYASRILNNFGITAENYIECYRHHIDWNQKSRDGYTLEWHKVKAKAVDFGSDGLESCVGTEHILYAVIQCKYCKGHEILSRMVDMEQLEATTRRYIAPAQRIERVVEDEPSDEEQDSVPSEAYTRTEELDPALSEYGEDLTRKARLGKLDPVIGRRNEIEKVIQVLSRRTKNNPVLIGEPGVGKSAVVEGLAQAIVSGEVPDLLRNKIVFSLNMTGLLAGTRYRGDFEDRLKKLVDVVMKDQDIILFIDEIHMIVGAGATTEGSMDASNILKPMLARGELQTVGATTYEEYRKFIEKDSALERRFTPVVVEQPSVEDTIVILRGLREKYEVHHNVIITNEALEAAARLSDRYITDRFLPDKAIDLIDEAASRERLRAYNGPKELHELKDRCARTRKEREKADRLGDVLRKEELLRTEKTLYAQCASMQASWDKTMSSVPPQIGAEEVAEIVSDWTGVPVSRLTETESERLMHLEEELHQRIVGQDEAVSAVAKAIRRARAGLKPPEKPIGSFVFVGPTGVGKTDLTKALAESLFGDERLMIRLDMSEFMEKHSVTKLIGAPPGYVGYDDGRGSLTERVRQKPYSVILFDEIEKAHPDIFNVLLQILDDGRLTDNKGRVVSFKNTVIILTSNVGAHEVKDVAALGFRDQERENEYADMKERIEDALKKQFRPEFLNRLDDVIIFHKLSKENAQRICEKMLDSLNKQLREKQIELRVSARAQTVLVEEGYSEEFGARPLKRVIRRLVEDRLSEEILRGRIDAGDTVIVDEENGKLVFMRGGAR